MCTDNVVREDQVEQVLKIELYNYFRKFFLAAFKYFKKYGLVILLVELYSYFWKFFLAAFKYLKKCWLVILDFLPRATSLIPVNLDRKGGDKALVLLLKIINLLTYNKTISLINEAKRNLRILSPVTLVKFRMKNSKTQSFILMFFN